MSFGDLPTYRSHKRVRAARFHTAPLNLSGGPCFRNDVGEPQVLVDAPDGPRLVTVSRSFICRMAASAALPKAGDWFIVEEGGHLDWLPAERFDGHHHEEAA